MAAMDGDENDIDTSWCPILCEVQEMKQYEQIELKKFLTVGFLNTIVAISVVFTSKYFFAVDDVQANASGYFSGLLVSYFLNGRWTFNYRGSHLVALLRFLLVSAGAYAANLVVVLACIHTLEWNDYISQAVGMPVYTIIFFIGSKLYVFKRPSDQVSE